MKLEQGKEAVRLDKVNQALTMFGKEAVPGKRRDKGWSQNIEKAMCIFKITVPELLLKQRKKQISVTAGLCFFYLFQGKRSFFIRRETMDCGSAVSLDG